MSKMGILALWRVLQLIYKTMTDFSRNPDELKETARSSHAVGKTYISKPRQMLSWISKPKVQAGEWYAGILALRGRATEPERGTQRVYRHSEVRAIAANELFLCGDWS